MKDLKRKASDEYAAEKRQCYFSSREYLAIQANERENRIIALPPYLADAVRGDFFELSIAEKVFSISKEINYGYLCAYNASGNFLAERVRLNSYVSRKLTENEISLPCEALPQDLSPETFFDTCDDKYSATNLICNRLIALDDSETEQNKQYFCLYLLISKKMTPEELVQREKELTISFVLRPKELSLYLSGVLSLISGMLTQFNTLSNLLANVPSDSTLWAMHFAISASVQAQIEIISESSFYKLSINTQNLLFNWATTPFRDKDIAGFLPGLIILDPCKVQLICNENFIQLCGKGLSLTPDELTSDDDVIKFLDVLYGLEGIVELFESGELSRHDPALIYRMYQGTVEHDQQEPVNYPLLHLLRDQVKAQIENNKLRLL